MLKAQHSIFLIGWDFDTRIDLDPTDRTDEYPRYQSRVSKRQRRMRRAASPGVPEETGGSTQMTRLRGRCLEGQRLYAEAQCGDWSPRPLWLCDAVV